MRRIKDKDLPLIWQLSWKLVLLCLVIFAVGCFFTNPLEWGCGVLLGCVFTVVRLFMMKQSVEASARMEPVKARRYARAQYVVRYFLSAAVLIAAALIPWINVIAAGLSMIALKLVTYIQGWLDKRYYPDEPDKFVEWEEESDEDQDWDRWEAYAIRSGRAKRQYAKLKEACRPPEEAAAEPDGEELGEPAETGEQLSLLDEWEAADIPKRKE